MVIRELKNGLCYVSTHEDHAELSRSSPPTRAIRNFPGCGPTTLWFS